MAADVVDLRSRTAELVEGTQELLKRAGRSDLAESLPVSPRADRFPAERPLVAVVGETSRGKSALVNALIGRPGISPVDPQVTTCVPVLFTYDDPEWAQVWIHQGAQKAKIPEPLDIPVADIAEYAHELRNPGNAKLVQRVEVGLTSPRLKTLDLTIADTPGVGGLISGHADLALAQLQTSDAVVLVLDAGIEISPSEVSFLRDAAVQASTVIIAVTKADLQFSLHRVVEVNRDRIRSEVPDLREPLLIPVSSRLVELAENLPDDKRAELRAASGLDDLVGALETRVRDRSHRAELTGVIEQCLQRLTHLDALLTAAAADIDEDRLRHQLADNINRLERLQSARDNWHASLINRLTRIGGEVVGHRHAGGDTVAADLDRLAADYEARARTADLQAEFDQLVVGLQADVVRVCARSTTALGHAVNGAFDAVVSDIALEDIELPDRVNLPKGANEPDRLPGHTIADYIGTLSPGMSVYGIVAAFSTALSPWWLLLVPPIAALTIYDSTAKARRRNFLRWLDEYLSTVDGAVRRTCESAVEAASSPEVRAKVDALIIAEIAAATTTVEQQTVALDSGQGARKAEARRVNDNVTDLATLAATAHLLRAALADDAT